MLLPISSFTHQDRRNTLQYILLEDNPPMTATVKHFEALLDVLTEHTWGLTVSLKDFASAGEGESPQVSAKKAAAAARKEPNYDYKETLATTVPVLFVSVSYF